MINIGTIKVGVAVKVNVFVTVDVIVDVNVSVEVLVGVGEIVFDKVIVAVIVDEGVIDVVSAVVPVIVEVAENVCVIAGELTDSIDEGNAGFFLLPQPISKIKYITKIITNFLIDSPVKCG